MPQVWEGSSALRVLPTIKKEHTVANFKKTMIDSCGRRNPWFSKRNKFVIKEIIDGDLSHSVQTLINTSKDENVSVIYDSCCVSPSTNDRKILLSNILSNPNIFFLVFLWIFDEIKNHVNVKSPDITSSFSNSGHSSNQHCSSEILHVVEGSWDSWGRNYSLNLLMLKFVSSICIHDFYPIFFGLIINPQISKYLTVLALSSINNQIVINTNHWVAISRSWSISFLWCFILPFWSLLFIHQSHDVVQKHLSSSHVFHSSEHPNWSVELCTSCVMLPWLELCIFRWTNDSKLCNFINSGDNFSFEFPKVSLNLEAQQRVLINTAKIKHSVMIEHVSRL